MKSKEENKEKKESHTIKLGKLQVTLEFLKDIAGNPLTKAFLGEFIILDAVTNCDNGIVDYVAFSEHFQPIKTNEEIPSYTITSAIEENEKKEKVYKFTITRI